MNRVLRIAATRWGAAALFAGVVVVAVGAPLWDYYFKKYDTPLQAGAAVIAVATFLGVWLLQRHAGAGRHDRNSMRDGIAAAFVVTYLVMVGWAAFAGSYFLPATNAGPAESARSPPLAQALIGNFTILTGVVVGGYFGADAVKQVTQLNAQRRQQAGGDSGDDDTIDTKR